MAIYHLHGQIIKRADGRSAVAAAAYRTGKLVLDKRLDQEFDYTRKQEVEESVILAPEGAPQWLLDTEALWNSVEAAEGRKNSQLAREFDVALPIELVEKNPEAAKEALKAWAHDEFVTEGFVVEISFHNMTGQNPHGHVMKPLRRLHAFAMEFAEGSPLVFEETKARDLNDWGYMDRWRKTWADHANAAIAEHGIDARIDHRTLIEQGITDREPGIHVGPTANAMQERGIETGRWLKNAMIWFDNAEPWFEENRRYVAFLDAELEEERRLAEEASRQAEAEKAAEAEALRIVAMADALEDLGDRLDRAMRRDVTAAAGSLKEAAEGLEGGISRCVATKVAALSDPGEKLATLSPAVSIEARKSRLANLGARLDHAIASVVEVDKRRLIDAEARLGSAALNQLSRSLDRAAGVAITFARARVAAATDRLEALRSTIGSDVSLVRSLSARLDSAAVANVRNQAAKLQRLARRLEAERPTRLARVLQAVSVSSRRLGELTVDLVRVLIRAGRYAGESVTYTLATIAGRRAEGRERKQVGVPQLEEVVDRIAKEETQSRIPDDYWQAEWLLYQLQILAKKKNVMRWEGGRPRLDLSLIPDRLQDHAQKLGTHPLVQAWLDERHGNMANRLMDLINGPEPVVKREKDGLVADRDRLPERLADFADHMLQHDDVIRLYAEAAVQRWQIAARGEQGASVLEARSQPDADIEVTSEPLAEDKTRSQTDHESSLDMSPYDEAVRSGRRPGDAGIEMD